MNENLKQKVYDRYADAVQALNRAEMTGDPDAIEAAGREWSSAYFDKYQLDTYGDITIEPLF